MIIEKGPRSLSLTRIVSMRLFFLTNCAGFSSNLFTKNFNSPPTLRGLFSERLFLEALSNVDFMSASYEEVAEKSGRLFLERYCARFFTKLESPLNTSSLLMFKLRSVRSKYSSKDSIESRSTTSNTFGLS